MKKFLTVLLALSVVFTYTVGTAFADVPDAADTYTQAAAEAEINQAAKDAGDAVDLALKNAIAAYDKTKFTGDAAIITKEAVAEVLTEKAKVTKALIETKRIDAINNLGAAINGLAPGTEFLGASKGKAQNDLESGYISFKDDYDAISAIVFTSNNTAAGAKYDTFVSSDARTTTLDDEFAREQFKLTKKTTLDDLAAYDLTVYSKEIAEGETQSNFDKASKVLTANIAYVNNITITATTALAAVKTEYDKIVAVYVKGVNAAASTGTLITADQSANPPGLKGIETTKGQMTEKTKMEIAKSKILASIKSEVAKALAADSDYVAAQKTIVKEQLADKPNQTAIAAAKKTMAEKEAAYAALEQVLIHKAEAVEKSTTFGDFDVQGAFTAKDPWNTFANMWAQVDSNSQSAAVSLALTMAQRIEALKAEAKLAEGNIYITGITAVEIQAALDAAIERVYAATTEAAAKAVSLDLVSAEIYLKDAKDNLIGSAVKTTVKVNKVTYPTVYTWTTAATLGSYEPSKYAEIRKIAADAEAAIKGAATVSDAEAAFLDAYKKLQAVMTQSEKDALYTPSGALYTAYNQYLTDIKAYAQYAVDKMPADDKAVYTVAAIQSSMEALLKEAYSAAELNEKYAEAKAKINALKTKAEVIAWKADLEKQATAMGNKVTVADREKVAALKAAIAEYNEYLTKMGCSASTQITSAKTLVGNNFDYIKAAEGKAVKDMYDALNAKTITAADAEAVKALRDAYGAFVAYYSDPEATAITEPTGVAAAAVAGIETKLAQVQADDFAKLVMTLPASVTTTTQAIAVQNAMKAYNALSDEAKAQLSKTGTVYTKLYVLNQYAESFVKDGVKATKIKIYSKAYKGYNKISWSKSLGFKVDGYEVYRSTKKNSGFKKIWTAKSTGKSVKNTKNLISGKRYYYYVKGFRMLDGEKVYTKKSITIYRTAK